MFTSLLKATDEYPDGRAVQGKVCGVEHGAAMPSPGMPHSQHLHVFTNLEALQTSYLWDFMEASSSRHNRSLTPFSALSLLRMGGRAEKSKLLIMTWSFQWPALIQEPIQSCFIRTKDIPITQEIIRVLRTMSETGVKDQTEKKRLLVLLSLKKLPGF